MAEQIPGIPVRYTMEHIKQSITNLEQSLTILNDNLEVVEKNMLLVAELRQDAYQIRLQVYSLAQKAGAVKITKSDKKNTKAKTSKYKPVKFNRTERNH